MKRLIKKSHFDNIDAIRFLAVLGIILSHCFITDNQQVKVSKLYSDLMQVTGNLQNVCYSLLFILTGFLNTWTIFEERFIYKNLNLLRFYMRRILGMLPLYFVMFVLGFFILPKFNAGIPLEYSEFKNPSQYLGFIFNFGYSEGSNPLNPLQGVWGNMWTIAVSFQFIIVWPILMSYFRRKEKVLMIIAMIAFIASAWMWSQDDSYRFSSLNIMCDFVVGSFMAYFSFFKYKLYGFLKNQTKRTIGFVYLAFILVLIFLNQIRFEFNYLPAQLVFIIERILLTLSLAFFIFEQNFNSNSVLKIAKLKIFNYPGKLAYSIYAYHAIAILIAYKIMQFASSEQSPSAVMILEPFLAIIIALVLAMFSTEYFEKKFTRLKKNYNPTREYNPVGLNDVKTKSS
jgi:peptidoglycan/LPS O-acetylase OafA/YrhL